MHASASGHPLGRYTDQLAEDAPCIARHCRDVADQAAPVAMCGRHLRLAFAYVLASEQPDIAARETPYWAPSAVPSGYVYFIRVGDVIKIGYSADPERRFREIATDMVLHLEPGTMADEKRCHKAFNHHRIHGEYFRPGPDLLAFIADLQRNAA